MEEKNLYVAPNIEFLLYSTEDIVCTSRPDGVSSEVGDGWDTEGWGE